MKLGSGMRVSPLVLQETRDPTTQIPDPRVATTPQWLTDIVAEDIAALIAAVMDVTPGRLEDRWLLR